MSLSIFRSSARFVAVVLCLIGLVSANAQTPISGAPVPSLAQLDTIMQQYMSQYSSPGASLSVTVDGRLVFARGYGYANTSTGEFVQPDSRFRIASNSKIITAVGILKLIEQGKLSLNTQPFVTILNTLTPPAGTTVDPRVYNITIQNLLEHKAGYDDTSSPDPVFSSTVDTAATAYGLAPPASPAVLISYMLGQPLQHDPGTTYAYSNLGYLTLGYIIEKVTGTPYATWIEQNIFNVANMTQTLPAASLAAGKLPYEVAYYDYPGAPLASSVVAPVGAQVPFPYGGADLELSLANGAWTSTPMDLLRLWDTLNGQYSYNILSGGQSTRIGDVPPLGQGYYYTFYGSLPGTNSLVHLNTSTQVVGRVVYSAIFNTRNGANIEEPELDADNAIQNFVQTVHAWPTGDLFPTYATSGTACLFTMASATATAPLAGATSTVTLTDANYCAWSAVANATWLHVTAGALNSDSGTVSYTVDANTGATRTGTITIAGQSFTVTQAGVLTATTLALNGTGTYVGNTETLHLTATLSPFNAGTAGETVTFTNTSTNATIGTGTLANGVATFSGTIPYSTSTSVKASYAGDATYSASASSIVTVTPTGSSATLAPTSLTFPSTPTGLTSASQTALFTNTGTTALSFNSVTVNGPFSQTNNCGTSVAASGTCTFTIVYSPVTAGPSSGSIDVNDAGGDQIVSLSGTAVASAPVVTLSAPSLTFSSTTVNTSSGAQTITVTNTGTAALNVSSVAAVSASSQFTQTNNCTTAAIAINGSCTINVIFSPTIVGPVTGTVTLTDNASPTTQSFSLTGTATAGPTPAVTLSPGSLTFPSTPLTTTSAAQTAMLTNSGTAALTITSITASTGFTQTNNCPASLAVNASCTIAVVSAPTAVGAYTGAVTITDNATPTTQSLTLSGTGAPAPAPAVALAPGSLTFAGTQLSTSSASQTSTLTNSGSAALTITSIVASAGFTVSNNCPSSLGVNASCSISVVSVPTAVGPYSGSVTITDNATPTAQVITLAGTGTPGPTPAVTVSPASLTFPATQVSSTSASQTAMLTNSGTAALTISAIAASVGFAQTNNCPASLPANASCAIVITSTPSSVGAYTGTVAIADNAAGSPHSLGLSGIGAAFSAPTIVASISSASLSYGQPVTVGATASGAQTAGNYTWSVLDGATVLASGIAYSATLSYPIATPTAGTHNYTAVLTSTVSTTTYPTGSSNAVTVVVAKASTSSNFPSPAAITYGTALSSTQLAATSATSGTFTYAPPVGIVLAAGTQSLGATLVPTDSTDYAGSTATTTIVVRTAPLSVMAAASTRAYGASNAFTGTITGIVNSDPITATYASTATATSAPGTYSITPALVDPSSRLANYTVTSTAGTLTITKANSAVTVTSSASTAPVGGSLTFTATVVSSTTGTPSGTVTFSNGQIVLGTGTLSAGGVATYTTAALPMGTAQISVSYSGDGNFNTSASTNLAIVVGLPDFSITATSSSSTIEAGQAATAQFTVSPTGGYSQTVTFSCSGLPTYASCNFAPPSVTVAGSPVSSTLTVSTANYIAGLQAPMTPQPRNNAPLFAFAALLSLPLFRRRIRNTSRLLALLAIVALGAATAAISGCGASNFSAKETPAGSYTVTVTATGGGSTVVAHSAVYTLTVKN